MRDALEALQPDVVVIEMPADVESALPLAREATLQPPVALLVYPNDEPRRATIYPFAVFSPEWQALQWGLSHNVPVRAMDLPMSHRLALDQMPQLPTELPFKSEDSATPEQKLDEPTWRTDPLALLAEAAGYHDHELWWEELIERRQDANGLFAAILDAMRAVREEVPFASERDLLREAFMRKTIRGVLKAGFQRVAVICGAWHAPVLDETAIAGKRPGCRIKEDNDRLKKLPKIKTIPTWIPWTHGRLAYRSGYGAGVHSPGWYAHLWASSSDAPTRWLVDAGRLLREQDLSASSASLIEASRLADALAALRDRRAPGLQELNEAILTVMCQGESAPLRLIRRRLELGDRLGSVPADAPAVPLDCDVKRLQTSLRLKPSPHAKMIDLDLRTENGRERSWLLHRLNLLGIAWGTRTGDGSNTSTFHEVWNLQWDPEFAIAIIEANVWGNTVVEATSAKVTDLALKTTVLSDLTKLLDSVLLAQLAEAVPVVMQRIQATAAVATDVVHLMEAVLPLARIQRYGDVRQTDTQGLEPILVGIVERVVAGLPTACTSVDDDAAARLVEAMAQVQSALDLLQWPFLADDWRERLRSLAEGSMHGLIRGWCCRSLLEQGLIDAGELDGLTRRALSRGVDPAQAAAWITGLLRGSGLLLLHQDLVWLVMDAWLSDLSDETFMATLPLLRRAFSEFSPAERRQMGSKLKRLQPDTVESARSVRDERPALNSARAALVLPVLAQILGVRHAD
ncbi:DUF5682 family protein [Planctomicrobium piriforme]|uniref:Uncharacterized protein n=1 Tax=Planctomicrobium piriforme TaxID=1576369 RepID=A0A1I3FCW8_9PLAN|nr:DUF5682 family protein [Planctomicrobium piriforme]SFI08994.1 hypothetical protein SAMN05421753_105181 [Planctomicrobium piriforme]